MNSFPGLAVLATAALLPTLHATIPVVALGDVDSSWQFENDLTETNGGTSLSAVGFTPAYASDTIDGGSANVLDLPALPATDWLEMPNAIGGNGGSLLGLTNNWTIVMDVKFPALATDAGLLQTDATNSNDAEVHVMGGPGVAYEYYETGALSVLPDFDTLTPVATGTVSTFDIAPRLRNDDFAFRFRGRICLPTDGSYTFYTTSDDGSQLLIDDVLIVDNDGLHSSQTISASATLTAGTHDIEVTFFERTGQEVLTVEYEGPGITRQVIPTSVLTQGDAGAIRLGATKIADPGSVKLDQWHRLALTCEVSGPNLECKAYLDGVQTEIGGSPVTLTKPFDGDYALPATLKLFTDDTAETQNLKVNSLSYWGGALTATEIAALGSPVTPGLPDLYVTNTNNTGLGSLRTSMENVRNGGIVFFDFPVAGQTVLLGTGGALDLTSKTLWIDALHLPSKPIVDGADSFRVFKFLGACDVTLRGLHLRNGQAGTDAGGAIRNEGVLNLVQCLLTESDAASGGAIINESTGNLTITDSVISDNTAGAGGGVTNAGTALLERCTIEGNVAGSSGGVEAINSTTVVNCTVVGNTATDGGGAGLASFGALVIISSTITQNDAIDIDPDPFDPQGGGGVRMDFTGDLTIDNCIIAGNTSNIAGEDNLGGLGGFGTFVELGNNLTSGAPLLDVLGDYGGLTQTMPPKGGSPAAAGGAPTGNTPATDQRGLPRINNGLDIGAVETDLEAGATLYGTWASENITSPPQDATFNGDSEGDGVENGQEYAFRMDPQLNDPLQVPMARPSAPSGLDRDLQIVIPFRGTGDDLVYIVHETTDLISYYEIYRYTVATATELKTDPNIITSVDVGAETITVTELAQYFNPITTLWRVEVLMAP